MGGMRVDGVHYVADSVLGRVSVYNGSEGMCVCVWVCRCGCVGGVCRCGCVGGVCRCISARARDCVVSPDVLMIKACAKTL